MLHFPAWFISIWKILLSSSRTKATDNTSMESEKWHISFSLVLSPVLFPSLLPIFRSSHLRPLITLLPVKERRWNSHPSSPAVGRWWALEGKDHRGEASADLNWRAISFQLLPGLLIMQTEAKSKEQERVSRLPPTPPLPNPTAPS